MSYPPPYPNPASQNGPGAPPLPNAALPYGSFPTASPYGGAAVPPPILGPGADIYSAAPPTVPYPSAQGPYVPPTGPAPVPYAATHPAPLYSHPPPSTASPQPYPAYPASPLPQYNPNAAPIVNPQQHNLPPLSGRKKAVLVGINYLNDPRVRLSGCINDAKCMKYLLQTKFRFPETSCVMLTDDQTDMNYVPTRRNILNALGWLVSDAQPGDSLFFHYSGHGSQIRDYNGDEADGYDETICPVDFKSAGMIVDDELFANICRKVPQGCRLTSVMDCCHSGTGLDLPYMYSYEYVRREGKQCIVRRDDKKALRTNRTTLGEIIAFSGCQDHQTSADTSGLSGGVYTGAMTYCFIKAVEAHYPNLSVMKLLIEMTRLVKGKGYKQTPQLSTGHGMDLNIRFEV